MARQSKKAQATRELLLRAALDVMSRKGYAEATIGEIAQAAGVSKGLAYYHFKSKAEMATEILRDGIDQLIERFEDIAETTQSGASALESMLDAFVELILDNIRFGSFYLTTLWREGRVWSEEMKGIEDRLVQLIAEQFRRGQESGEVRAGTDPEFDAVACIGLVLTATMRYFGIEGKEGMGKSEFTKQIIDFVSHALRQDAHASV